MSWKEFAAGSPEMAEFGQKRFASEVAYLATVKKDGGPRVHPVTPITGEGRLFLFMEPTSPKGHDLRRDGRYALHCSVADSGGGQGEFLITGTAELVEDPGTRSIAVKHASYAPADRYILFELAIDTAFSTEYDVEGSAIRNRWQRLGD
jgi:hypothetical protein